MLDCHVILLLYRSKRNQNNVLFQSISEFRVTKRFANDDSNQSTWLNCAVYASYCECLTCQSQWKVHFRLIFVAVDHRCDVEAWGIGKRSIDDGSRVDLYQTAISLTLVPDDGVTEGVEADSTHRASQRHVVSFAGI